MEFQYISPRLTPIQIKWSKEKFQQTTLELGVRENNEHVGTGKGGNNFQLLFLFGVRHQLSDKSSTIQYNSQTKTMVWSGKWMEVATRSQIRDELDSVFKGIQETHKLESLMLVSLAMSHDLRKTLSTYKDQFPKLIASLSNTPYKVVYGMTLIEQLILGSLLCQELAVQLDNKDTTNVSVVGKVLEQLSHEIVLLTVRKYIQIERLVRDNLDEHPDFGPVLHKITKKVR